MNIKEKFYCSKCMREVDDDLVTCEHCGYEPNQESRVYVLEEGTLFQNGRYQLGAVIGSGGFGITYAAWDCVLNQPVAIKEYFPQNLCERDVTEDDNVIINPEHEGLYQKGLIRFIREAKILGTLQNVKNVVPVLEWFEGNNTAYIVMQYIRGVTLEKYVKENKLKSQEIISMMKDIIEALSLVHKQGIIHRDLSPSNIMVKEDGTMVLIDFGAASVEELMAQGENKTAIYNRKYAPLEQYDESGMQGAWTDVYALSATLYYLLCGEPPTESVARVGNDNLKSPNERKAHLKKYQNKAIMSGLILQPEKRIQSMDIFRSMLYNLPMPEEVIRRRKFMFRVISVASLISIVSILTVINLTYGFFLGNGMRYSLYRDGFHVRGFANDRENLVIPEKILGINVVGIDRGAFQGSEILSNVKVPGSVKNIDEFAFNACENLTSVTLNEGVKKLSSQSLANCNNLQAVITPDSLSEFRPDTFTNSERLILLCSLQSQAAKLAKEYNLNYAQLFLEDNDSGITIVQCKTENTYLYLPDLIGEKVVTIISCDYEKTPVFPAHLQKITLPKKLEKIGSYAFHGVRISNIEFPDTLKYIGEYAFSSTFIEKLSLPDSVTLVGMSAFSPCLYLKDIKLSPNMKEIPGGCFGHNTALESIKIPEGIKEIRALAFSNCSNLSSVELPYSLVAMDGGVFQDCISLESLFLPPNFGRMRIGALDGCPKTLTIIGFENTFAQSFSSRYNLNFYNLSKQNPKISTTENGNIIVNNDIEEIDEITLPAYHKSVVIKKILRANPLKSKRVILPEKLEEIATVSFSNNKYLEKISFPENLQKIGKMTFAACDNLVSVDMNEGLNEIGDLAFFSCKGLTEIKLPSTLKILDGGAFQNCTNLTKINIPESLVVLENDVLSNVGITSITIPGNVVRCGTSFYGCKNLKEAVIEEGVRALWGTFANCDALETVTIPSSVNQISRSTFKNCRNLKDVWIYSDKVDLDSVQYGGVGHMDFLIDTMDLGKSPRLKEFVKLEEKNYVPLFADSSNLTIHAHKGSNAHLYANTHNIKFVEIPKDENSEPEIEPEKISYKSTERVYSDERIIFYATPKKDDDLYLCWGKFQYALGYNFMDLAYKCLDAYAEAGKDYDKLAAKITKLFLEQRESLGYSTGEIIVFFENFQEHPILKTGDIIIEINGTKFKNNKDMANLLKLSKSQGKTSAEYTILRLDENNIFQKLNLTVPKGLPLHATMEISPKTFEEIY